MSFPLAGESSLFQREEHVNIQRLAQTEQFASLQQLVAP